MPTSDDIAWFKREFGADIAAATAGTPFDLDMLAAIASQETGYIWGPLRRKGLARSDVLALCVGDTLDRSKTFPRDRAHLESVPGGKEMFKYANEALKRLAKYVPDYGPASRNPLKFCKGFGIFQYDLQFFGPKTKAYFMGGYADFPTALARCLTELHGAMGRAKVKPGPGGLTDMQKAAVAIAYNTGGYKPAKGLMQGHKPKNGPYYGQAFYKFLQLAKSVEVDIAQAPPAIGKAVMMVIAGMALPFGVQFLISGADVFDLVTFHGTRGVQLESLLATVMAAARTFGYPAQLELWEGGVNLTGALAPVLLAVSNVVLAGVIAGLAFWFFRQSGGDDHRTVVYVGCLAVAGSLIAAKVLSPQYLIWAIPVLLIVSTEFFRSSRAWWTVAAALIIVAALTAWLFPHNYFNFKAEPFSLELTAVPRARLTTSFVVVGIRNVVYLVVVLALTSRLLRSGGALKSLDGKPNLQGRPNRRAHARRRVLDVQGAAGL